jgi:hypothetical protein
MKMSVTAERKRKLRKAAPRGGNVGQKGSRQNVIKKEKPKLVTAGREEKLKRPASPSGVVYRGLCSTCEGAANCTFPRDPNRPILHCDELDSYKPETVTVKEEAGAELSTPKAASRAKKKEAGEYKGLCVNCENRETCTFPKPEGGVWHCDEYC